MSFSEELNTAVATAINEIRNIKNESNLFSHKLNDQQCLSIIEMRERDFFLNYSDTGAGKTKAAIAVSYYVPCKHTLILCPNSVKNTWKTQINEAEMGKPKQIEIDNIITNYSDDEWTYEIFNYEKFNSESNAVSRIKSLVRSKSYDLIVFDEVHRLKNKNAQTYEQVSKMLAMMHKVNPKLKILGATATPITTSNADLQGIYELMSNKKADEVNLGTIATKLINANKILETMGFGYFPESKIPVRYNGIDSKTLFKVKAGKTPGKQIFHTDLAQIDGSSIEEDCIKYRHNVCKREELHIDLKFDNYKQYLGKGVVIFTQYTYGDYILNLLKSKVENEGYSCAIYSGGCKETDDGTDSINAFVNGKFDVLIGTTSMTTGVDGLQKVCNKLILHNIPAVWSEFHQLIGRFDRTGSNFEKEGVDVYVPMVVFNLEDGNTVSFDKRRWNLCMYRKTKDDITKGGHLDEISVVEKEKLVDEVIDKLKNNYELTQVFRRPIEIDIDEFDTDVVRNRANNFVTDIHRSANTSKTSTIDAIMSADNGKNWKKYHETREVAKNSWEEDPVDVIAEMINAEGNGNVIADLGCGMAKLNTLVGNNNKVYSVDFYSDNENVIKADATELSEYIKDEELDIAVYCLSLWGTNWQDNFKEAYRMITSKRGELFICEPNNKFGVEGHYGTIDEFIKIVESHGFKLLDNKYRFNFNYFRFIKVK